MILFAAPGFGQNPKLPDTTTENLTGILTNRYSYRESLKRKIQKMSKRSYQTHSKTIEALERKKRIAEMKCEERKLKSQILKLRFPFQFNLKFNKVIVSLSIAAIIAYTIAAILLQKCTMMELSPTLTTCVYAFFGTELTGLAGIKICDTKFTNQENSTNYSDTGSSQVEKEDAVG